MATDLREYCEAHNIVFGGTFCKDETKKFTRPRYFMDTKRNGALYEVDDQAKLANRTTLQTYEKIDGYEKNPVRYESNPRAERDYYDTFKLVSVIGKKHGKTNSQVVIRWGLQHGVITTPHTIKRSRMDEYINVFDFELTQEEMDRIDSLNCGLRIGYNPDYIDF
jgi:hypothetical protein